MTDKRTTTTEALLGMLAMGPMSGYDLRRQIDFSIGNFWTESFGQIYPALRKLEGDGLVQSEEKGKAGRKVYRLTDAGRERLEDWLQVTPRPRVPRNETLLKLFLGANTAPEISAAHVREFRGRFAADVQRYAAMEAHLKGTYPGHPGLPYWVMVLHFGRDEARMIVNWCDETLQVLGEISAKAGQAPVSKRRKETEAGRVSHAS